MIEYDVGLRLRPTTPLRALPRHRAALRASLCLTTLVFAFLAYGVIEVVVLRDNGGSGVALLLFSPYAVVPGVFAPVLAIGARPVGGRAVRVAKVLAWVVLGMCVLVATPVSFLVAVWAAYAAKSDPGWLIALVALVCVMVFAIRRTLRWLRVQAPAPQVPAGPECGADAG